MKIVVTGTTGMIGSALVPFLKSQGHEVFALVRKKAHPDDILWNPEERTIEKEKLEGLDAIIHLAGENISEGRWTDEKKKKIRNSRVAGTTLLSQVLTTLNKPPRTFLHASAVGFYGNRGNESLTEVSPHGKGFLAEVCRDWEGATELMKDRGIRIIPMRFGIVLSANGGILKQMQKPFQFGLGGVVGSGNQFMSWIAIEDLLNAIVFVLEERELKGAFNFVAPNPVTNREFTKTLGRIMHRPTILPLPSFLARWIFGEMADDLLLSSTRVVPKRLLQSNFIFKYPLLEDALKHLLS